MLAGGRPHEGRPLRPVRRVQASFPHFAPIDGIDQSDLLPAGGRRAVIAPWDNIAIHCLSDINGAPGPAWLRATDPEREFGAMRIDDHRNRFNGQPGGGNGGRA